MADLIDPFSVPRVGVAILIDNTYTNEILMMQRGHDQPHGAGLWSLPGGHWEMKETAVACAARELKEETGLEVDVDNVSPLGYTEDHFPDNGRQYITLFFHADYRQVHGAARNLEPHKTAQVCWVRNVDVSKRPLFTSFQNLLRGANPYRDPLLYALRDMHRQHARF